MLADLDTAEFNGSEDIDVRDIARQTDMTIVLQIELRRWRIMNKQVISHASDKVTLLLIFNVRIINSVYVRFGERAEEMVKERRLKWFSPKMIIIMKIEEKWKQGIA